MSLAWPKHPLLEPPSDLALAAMSPEEIAGLHDKYLEAIRNADEDPLRYGYHPERWSKADSLFGERDEVLILGGNRGSKTVYGAKTVITALIENPDSLIFAFAQNASVSVRQIQSVVYDWLPREHKKRRRESEAYVSYSRKNGFTGGSFILPNRSQLVFMHYSQFMNDQSIIEGAELGSMEPNFINIGVWLDEYLLGGDLLDTLRFRLATRNAKALITFTPKDGYTDVVRSFLEKAETTEEEPPRHFAKKLEGRKIPITQLSKNRNAGIVYFPSDTNPFGGWQRVKKELRNASPKTILIRFYGVPTKSATSQFPKFSRDVNVVPRSKVPVSDVTRYQLLDPAGAKNWFSLWVAVDSSGTWWVYNEWPGVDIGDWAEWSDDKWRAGDGCKGLGYGIDDYVDLFTDLEEGAEIYERIIDPRLGSARYASAKGSSSIIEDLADLDCIVTPAPGLDIEDGLQALQTLMSYDTEKPIDAQNRPHFYVTEDCENFIAAIQEYTGEDGPKEAWKDPIDCARYGAISAIDHVEEHEYSVTTKDRGGY